MEEVFEIKKNRQCLFPLCQFTACFNAKGEKKGIYCSLHKEKDMKNVIHKLCLDCETRPSFNYREEKLPIYCALHKKADMIDVTHKTCLDCKSQPSYNFREEKTAIYCYLHKKDDMIDVKHKTCLKCDTQPCFNFREEKIAIYCSQHKEETMVDVINKTCLDLDCDTQPYYNFREEKIAIYCSLHKKEDMVDVKNKKCSTLLCDTFVKNKYKGLCTRCFILTYPDEKVSRNYKTKEKATCDFILEAFPNFTFQTDRRVPDGCSKRRPDMLLEMGEKIIVVEIDEHQHNNYDTMCENKRLMEMSKDLGHRPLVMIRFNPDEYKNENGKRVQSCWSTNKRGICIVSKSKAGEWQERLRALEEEIKCWVEQASEKTIHVVNLFFNK